MAITGSIKVTATLIGSPDGPERVAIVAWTDRYVVVRTETDGDVELPAIGGELTNGMTLVSDTVMVPYVDAMVHHYIIAALWSTPNYGPDADTEPTENLDALYGPHDVTPSSVERIKESISAFVAENWIDLAGMSPEQAGHDFLLTRDGHGAGFWDRGLGDRGDRLTKASEPYGSSEFFADNGEIHGT